MNEKSHKFLNNQILELRDQRRKSIEREDKFKKLLESAKNIFLQLNNLKHHGIDEECWRWESWLKENEK